MATGAETCTHVMPDRRQIPPGCQTTTSVSPYRRRRCDMQKRKSKSSSKSYQIAFPFDPLWFGYGSSHFRIHIHIPRTIVDLLPHGFIRSPCRPDLVQAIFESGDTFPKTLLICFQVASFGYLSVQIWIRQFSNTSPQIYINPRRLPPCALCPLEALIRRL